jgi:hypothetical protein
MTAVELRRVLVGVSALLLTAGCSALLSLGDYSFSDAADASADHANGETGAGDGAAEDAGCDVDLAITCYACVPTTTEQFLNSCTEGACVSFDRNRLNGLLLPDGGLPPLPGDGG